MTRLSLPTSPPQLVEVSDAGKVPSQAVFFQVMTFISMQDAIELQAVKVYY